MVDADGQPTKLLRSVWAGVVAPKPCRRDCPASGCCRVVPAGPAGRAGQGSPVMDAELAVVGGRFASGTVHRCEAFVSMVTIALSARPASHIRSSRAVESAHDPVGDDHRSQSMPPAQVHDLADHRLWRPVRRQVRPRAAVGHAGRALGAVAVGPALGGGPGDVEHRCSVGDRPAVPDEGSAEPQSVAWGQGGISVGQEHLWARGMGAFSTSTPRPQVLLEQDPSDRVVTRPQPTSPISTTRAGRRRSAAGRPVRTCPVSPLAGTA